MHCGNPHLIRLILIAFSLNPSHSFWRKIEGKWRKMVMFCYKKTRNTHGKLFSKSAHNQTKSCEAETNRMNGNVADNHAAHNFRAEVGEKRPFSFNRIAFWKMGKSGKDLFCIINYMYLTWYFKVKCIGSLWFQNCLMLHYKLIKVVYF